MVKSNLNSNAEVRHAEGVASTDLLDRVLWDFISQVLLSVCVVFFVIDRIEVDKKLQRQVASLSQRIVQLETQRSGLGQVVSVNPQSSSVHEKHTQSLKSSKILSSE